MNLKRFTKPRFLFVYPLLIALFFVGRVTDASFRAGIGLIVLGEALRLWANGYVGHVKVNWTQKARGDAKIGRLITGGPYAFVRHPLYLGTLLMGSGFCMVVGSLWLAALACICFALFYRDKMRAEDVLLLDECGAEYAGYHAAVPGLLPRWRRYGHREGVWSWRGIQASKEWRTVIWATVLLILLYFWEEHQERARLFSEHRPLRFSLIAVAAVLILVDAWSGLRHRRSAKAAGAV